MIDNTNKHFFINVTPILLYKLIKNIRSIPIYAATEFNLAGNNPEALVSH